VHPRLALLIDAGTFLLSALIIGLLVHGRQPLLTRAQRTHLLKETAQGFRVVFGTPVLRAIAVTVLAMQLFTSPPEGLAAPWARHAEHVPARWGLAQGLIMMGAPFGYFIGALVINRFVGPDLRRRLIRPFAVLAPATLVPSLFDPPALVVALMAALCGVCVSGLVPASNGLFVQVLPRQYRARAFGVMQSGLQVTQGGAVMVVGLIAAHGSIPTVVGLWSVGGVALVLAVSARWPSANEFEVAIERNRAANAAAEAAERTAGLPVPPLSAPEPSNGSSAGRHRRISLSGGPGTMEG
jgi:MFS family permease